MTNPRRPWLVAVACFLGVAACTAPPIDSPFDSGAADTPTPRLEAPTPPPEPSLLVVCLAAEPDTLYLYGNPNASARSLFPLLYDGPFDIRGYRVEPVILEAVPSQEAGTIRLESVSLLTGDLYFNPVTRLAEELRFGKPFFPAGCASPDCQRTYQGGGAQLDRMLVDFRLKPGVQWSDGTPLTAADSVFSFRLDSNPETPTLKDQVNRTAAYQALDELTVRWTGIPGFFDPEAATNFWTPLPEHLLGGQPAGDLPGSAIAGRQPLGWGPYQLEAWAEGESIELVPNPNYGGGDVGFERVLVRFLPERGEAALQQVLTGECDVLEEALIGFAQIELLIDFAGQGRLQLATTPGTLVERLDFNALPADDRPGILESIETRKALAACLDRAGLVGRLIPGMSPVPSGYLTSDHPLASALAPPADDPGTGAKALADLGWVDSDGDPATARVSQGVTGVPGGTPLTLSLATTDDEAHRALAQALAEQLATCGVEVEVETIPAAELFTPWPDGPVFGRSFDLVAWSWLQWMIPDCESFTSGEIASSQKPEGTNAAGFSNPAFDAACAQVGLGEAATPEFRSAVGLTETILADALPALPLFQWPRILVAGPQLCGFDLDPTAAGLLWDVESWRAGADCDG